jgi:hypothetical protein
MRPAASSADPLGTLLRLPLRLPGRVWYWLVSEATGRAPVGDDGLTDAERAEAAARFRKVANAPIPEETRLRVDCEGRAGTRQVVRISHPR